MLNNVFLFTVLFIQMSQTHNFYLIGLNLVVHFWIPYFETKQFDI